MGDYAQHQQSNHQLKILLATLDNTLLHKINEFLFFGKKPKEKKNHNDSNNLTLPTTITFQQLMIMLSYNLYIYIEVDLSYHNLNDEKIIHLTNELQNSNHGHYKKVEATIIILFLRKTSKVALSKKEFRKGHFAITISM